MNKEVTCGVVEMKQLIIWLLETARLGGLLTFAIGFTGGIGHLLEMRNLYTWLTLSPAMAVPTAVALTASGLAIVVLCHRLSKLERLHIKRENGA